MLSSRKRAVLYTGLIVAALLFAYCLRSAFHPLTSDALLAISMMTLRWAIHITLTVSWCIFIHRRILHTAIRRLLLSVGGLLLFWQLVRIVKYDYVIITEPVGRYCWYAYYIAMVLVPLIGVFVINYIGKPEGYRSPIWLRLLFIPAFFLIAVVFTNDLHQLVFTFHKGFALYNSDYGYGFMYIIVMAWFMVLALFFTVMLMVKSRVPGSKSFQKLPLFIAVFSILFWAGYSMKLYTGDLTAVDSLIIITMLESAIQSGLIPSNMNYNELFRQSTIAAQIADSRGVVHYRSAAARPLDKLLMEKAQLGPVEMEDTVLHSQSVHSGFIYWQDDVREINELAAHLREANSLLGEQYDLLKAEVDLKERKLHAEEKARLYDRIAQDIAPQLQKADALLHKIRINPAQADALLSQICVISAYIKRRANLILLGEENTSLPIGELTACLLESLDQLQLCGVSAQLFSACEGSAAVGQIIALYDLFDAVTEQLLGQLTAMIVTVSDDGGVPSLRIQAGCKDTAPALQALSLPGGNVKCTAQDSDLIVEAIFSKGGAQA